jgi:hypothetical protein
MTLGDHFTFATELPFFETTSSSYISRKTMTTPTVTAGDYFVFASMSYQNQFTPNDFQVRLMEGAVEIMNSNRLREGEPTLGAISSGGMTTLFGRRTLAAGAHTYDIQFRRQGGVATDKVAIENLRLAFFGVSGAGYQQAESLGASTNSTTTYQIKVALSAGALSAGKYHVGFIINYQNETNTNHCKVRFRRVAMVGGTTILFEEFFNNSGYGIVAGTPFQSLAWYFPCMELTADTYTFELHFRDSNIDTKAVVVEKARIVLWKLP